jgi:hypothetical protein
MDGRAPLNAQSRPRPRLDSSERPIRAAICCTSAESDAWLGAGEAQRSGRAALMIDAVERAHVKVQVGVERSWWELRLDPTQIVNSLCGPSKGK